MDGHPLPASDEARHDEIPDDLERRKGVGDDDKAPSQPDAPVDPDGTPYGFGGSSEMNEDDRSGEAPPSSQDVANREAAASGGEKDGGPPGPGGVERGASGRPSAAEAEFARDQRAHQDQGQSDIERD
jgi:hypothetical protein